MITIVNPYVGMKKISSKLLPKFKPIDYGEMDFVGIWIDPEIAKLEWDETEMKNSERGMTIIDKLNNVIEFKTIPPITPNIIPPDMLKYIEWNANFTKDEREDPNCAFNFEREFGRPMHFKTLGISDIIIPVPIHMVGQNRDEEIFEYIKAMRGYMPDLCRNVIYKVRKKTGVDPTTYNLYELLPYAFMLPGILQNPCALDHYMWDEDEVKHFYPEPDFAEDMKRILTYVILTGPEFDSVRYLWDIKEES